MKMTRILIALTVSLSIFVSAAFAQAEYGYVKQSGGSVNPVGANLKMMCYVTTSVNPDTDDWVLLDNASGLSAGITYDASTGFWSLQEDNFDPNDIAGNGDTFNIRFFDTGVTQANTDTVTVTNVSAQNMGTTTLASATVPGPVNVKAYGGDARILLLWPNSAPTVYRLYKQQLPGSAKFQRVAVAQNSPNIIASLTNGTAYTYVAAPGADAANLGAHSNVVTATPNTTNTPVITANYPLSPVIASTRITLEGTNLGASGNVYFLDANNNTIEATQYGWSTGRVTIEVPAGLANGPHTLYLINNFSRFDDHTITVGPPGLPTITALSQSYVAVNQLPKVITITGTGFTGVTGVTLGGTPLVTYTVVNPTTINATVPVSFTAGAYDFAVTNAAGTSVNVAADDFTVVGIPTISNINPNTGANSGTTSITITGTNLLGTKGVTMDTVPVTVLAYTVVSNTQITATVPAALTLGTYNIRVTHEAGISANTVNDDFQVTSGNLPPLAPLALSQYRSNGTTVIPNGGWTNQSTVILRMSMQDPNNPDTLVPSAEVRASTATFSNIPNYNGAGPVGYTTVPVPCDINVTGLANGSYKWQARVRDLAGATGPWAAYPTPEANFRVDLDTPVISSSGPINGATGVATNAAVTVTFSDPLSGLDLTTLIAGNFTVVGGKSGSHNPISISVTGNTVTINYTNGLATDETVTVTANNIMDIAGNTLIAPNHSFSFTTSADGNPADNRLYERAGGIMMAYPNPFDPTDTANPLKMLFGAPTGEAVSIYIFDSNGRVIWQVKDSQLTANRIVNWEGDTAYGEVVENGLYLIRVVKGSKVVAKGKIIVLKSK